MFSKLFALPFCGVFLLLAGTGAAQTDDDAVRVTMTLNPDGSKTVYRTDASKHQSTAITTTASGKAGGKIIYTLDAEGRYESGRVFAANGAFRFKTLYRYDSAGRLAEESQLDQSDAVMHRIVYSFDTDGHATGYAIFDASGNLIGQTTPKQPAKAARKAHR